MPHSSASYPVTSKLSPPPQPHLLQHAPPSATRVAASLSGWFAFVTAGVVAITFMVTVHVYGGTSVFMQFVSRTAGLVPISKQGRLRVYPLTNGTDNGIQTFYTLRLPSDSASRLAEQMDSLIRKYPLDHGTQYHNCWLENPSRSQPCFFDVSWISQTCSRDNSYGFQESGGSFSPCLVLSVEGTGDWHPDLLSFSEVPFAVRADYDPGFMPIDCHITSPDDANSTVSLTAYPPKGYSHAYFPISRFDPRSYLPPLFAVKVHNLGRGQDVTVECSIITSNAFFLVNNGRATITFRVE